MKCIECNKEMKKIEKPYHYTESGLDNVYLFGIDVFECDDCRNVEAKIPRIEMLHMVIAKDIISQPRLLNNKEIKYLRKYIGIRANRLAKLMHIDKATVSRWENGKKPILITNDILLRLLVIRSIEEKRIELVQGKIISAIEEINPKSTEKRDSKIIFDPVTTSYSMCY